MSISGSKIQISNTSYTYEEIDKIIDGLPQELLVAMKDQNVVITKIDDVKKPLTRAIYDAKKKELIKQLRTQINFRMPQSLKNKTTDDSTKKDLLFYKNAYEEEAKNINSIIISTNTLNNHLLEPLQEIKGTLKKYLEDYKNNLKNVGNPYENKKEGIDKVNINNEDVNNEMNSYQEQSIKFFQEYNSMNKEISNEIKLFIDSFNSLKDSVNNLKKEIMDGFSVVENSPPEFEDLGNTERIRKAMSQIMAPLSKITKLISESEEQLTKAQENEKIKKEDTGLTNKMLRICEELKKKAKLITDKINIARMKVNLNEIKAKELEIKAPDVKMIEENISQIKEKIAQTNEDNSIIKEEVMKRTKIFINQTRLDILFIIDTTNSINTYLDDIKNNFNYMINEIYNNCPTSSIYIGFIGYSDFSELDFGIQYIDIDFIDKKEDIHEQIKELKPKGGGDEAEDLCGALDLALKKSWEGLSRFAIIATDAPCHGKEFHSSDVEDNFEEGDPSHRDIKGFIKEFAQRNISLFFAEFNDKTKIMFDIFEKQYKEGKNKDSDCECTIQSCKNLCETIIQKATNIYKNKKMEKTEGK